MITEKDINKLEKIFATKKELYDLKIELKAEMIAMRVSLKKEIKADMEAIAQYIVREIREVGKKVDRHKDKIEVLELNQEDTTAIVGKHETNWGNLKHTMATM